MAVHTARGSVGRRLGGSVLDLGGSDSHRTMHRRSSITRCVVLSGPDDPELAALAQGSDRFDHVLAVCALSRAKDIGTTLASISTVLERDGRLHFVEPIATSSRARTVSRFARPVVTATAGFHLDRDVVRSIRSAGFTICDIHRERPSTWRWPYQHLAWGSARHSRTPHGAGAR